MNNKPYTLWWVRYLKNGVWHAEEMTGIDYGKLKYEKNVTIIDAERTA